MGLACPESPKHLPLAKVPRVTSMIQWLKVWQKMRKARHLENSKVNQKMYFSKRNQLFTGKIDRRTPTRFIVFAALGCYSQQTYSVLNDSKWILSSRQQEQYKHEKLDPNWQARLCKCFRHLRDSKDIVPGETMKILWVSKTFVSCSLWGRAANPPPRRCSNCWGWGRLHLKVRHGHRRNQWNSEKQLGLALRHCLCDKSVVYYFDILSQVLISQR